MNSICPFFLARPILLTACKTNSHPNLMLGDDGVQAMPNPASAIFKAFTIMDDYSLSLLFVYRLN
jgi:hypothetical protein